MHYLVFFCKRKDVVAMLCSGGISNLNQIMQDGRNLTRYVAQTIQSNTEI